jgi:membrane dipeptidase
MHQDMQQPPELKDHLQLHRLFTLVDAHSDLVADILRRRERGEKAVLLSTYAQELRDAGIKVMMMSTGGDAPVQNIGSGDPMWCTLKRILAIQRESEESGAAVRLCRSMAEVETTVKEGKLALLMMIEGGRPLRDDVDTVEFYYRVGIRSIQLTWNARNLLGDGCAESASGGKLTRFGKAVVREMNRLGMLIDLSHSAESTFYSVAETSTAPFIVSHANARALCNHLRNLTDDQLKLLAQKGGLVGACFFFRFIDTERPSMSRLLDHVDHIAGLVGTDYIAIGADLIYYALDIFQAELTGGGGSAIYGAGGFDMPDDLRDLRSFALFSKGLLERGYSREDVEKIMGGNLLRLYRKVIG